MDENQLFVIALHAQSMSEFGSGHYSELNIMAPDEETALKIARKHTAKWKVYNGSYCMIPKERAIRPGTLGYEKVPETTADSQS